MRQLYLIIFLILTFTQNVNSQDRTIKGDTTFWYRWNQGLVNKLELTDFKKQQTDFLFRFRNHGQVVEIIKNNNQITAELTNYIYSLSRRTFQRKDTIFQKVKIAPDVANNLYRIIQSSGILSLKSDNEIDNWMGGADGITYIIEHSEKTNYWFKQYWTPSVQDSIPESLIVMNFVKAFSDTLQLSDKYNEFKNSLPKNVCYNSGGMGITCYNTNSFGFGYSGSIKLPFGYFALLNLAYIGKINTNFGVEIQHRFDNKKSSDFELTFGKNNILIHNRKTNDILNYSFRSRKLIYIDSINSFRNHRFNYGVSLKNNLSLAAGFDYFIHKQGEVGAFIYASKWFTKPQLSFMIQTSIFRNEIDYKLGVSKSFSFYRASHLFNRSSIGLYFENFKEYNDLYLTLSLWL